MRRASDKRWQSLREWLNKRMKQQDRVLRVCLKNDQAAIALVPLTRAQEIERILEHMQRIEQESSL